MAYNLILVKKEEGVATVAFNRPDRLNAINEELTSELISALDEVGQDDGVRVVVLTGVGRAFCAGADISRRPDRERIVEETHPESFRRRLLQGPPVACQKLQRMEKPTIAMVNGAAVGAGFGFALACDMRFGSEQTRFRVAFTTIGLVPGTGDAWFLPRLVGVAKAAELLFSGDFVDGAEAYRLGLLNRLVPHEKLESETVAFARRLAKNPPIALRYNKQLLYRGLETALDTSLELAASLQATALQTDDHREGIAAFREKREPVFKGR